MNVDFEITKNPFGDNRYKSSVPIFLSITVCTSSFFYYGECRLDVSSYCCTGVVIFVRRRTCA